MRYGKTTLRALRAIDRFFARQSRIGNHPVFEASQFPWVAPLEANWKTIRAELEEILKAREHIPSFHDISPDQQRISKGDNWKTFVLYGFGRQAERNCRRCPGTVGVLERIPGLQNAWFSILAPGYHIPPHCGVTRAVVRCHLALIVPGQRERCRIRVDGQIRQWQEGKCLVFDDTYEHEVWNDTDQERVVLFLDINRPMRLPGRLLGGAFIRCIQWTAYVKDARKNLANWENRFEIAVQRAETFHYDGESSGASKQENQAHKL